MLGAYSMSNCASNSSETGDDDGSNSKPSVEKVSMSSGLRVRLATSGYGETELELGGGKI